MSTPPGCCARLNRVDLTAAERLGLVVARVPSCSPEAVAEHAVALMLTLNRKTHKAYLRVREANPALAAVTARPRLAPQPRAVALS